MRGISNMFHQLRSRDCITSFHREARRHQSSQSILHRVRRMETVVRTFCFLLVFVALLIRDRLRNSHERNRAQDSSIPVLLRTEVWGDRNQKERELPKWKARTKAGLEQMFCHDNNVNGLHSLRKAKHYCLKTDLNYVHLKESFLEPNGTERVIIKRKACIW